MTATRARLARVSAIAAMAALMLCACGGGTAGLPSGATGATATTWPGEKCGIVSETVVGAIVHETVTAENFPPVSCQYLGDVNGVLIDYYRITAECAGAEARTDNPRIVDGLGAHAAFVSANIDEALAVTLDNGLCFFVHGTYGGDVDSDAARIAIAKAVIASWQAPGGAAGEPTGTPGAEWPDDRCSIVSEELVGAAVGEAYTAKDHPPVGCYYFSQHHHVLIDYYGDAAECERAWPMTDDPEIVDGLGAHAAFTSESSFRSLVVTLDNGLCFALQIGGMPGEVSDAAFIAIAEAVIAAS